MNHRQVIKGKYISPIVQEIQIPLSLNFLVSFSGLAGIEDWEDEGEEL